MFLQFFHTRLIPFFFASALAGTTLISPDLLNQVNKDYGSIAVARLNDWQSLIDSSHNLSEQDKLKVVNDFFNQMHFISDQEHWGEEDFWATPVEFLASGGGDCEDFSIAKYFTLKALGVDDARLRITYVRATTLNQAHMVLSYFPQRGQEPVVLDNLEKEIKPASKRRDLKPVYNFNGDGLWVSRKLGSGIRVGESDRIKLWTQLRDRLEASTRQKQQTAGEAGKRP